MSAQKSLVNLRWTRAYDGALWGVCKGLARALNLPVGALRLFWLASVILGGVGLWTYLIFVIAFPREDRVENPFEPVLLGVCARLAQHTHLEVGVVRLLAILLSLVGLGTTGIAYLLLYFFGPKNDRASATKP